VYFGKGYPESKTFLLPNLVDLAPFIYDKNRISRSKIRIGYCGTPTFEGGILDLIEAFSIVKAKNNETELIIIGDVADNSQLPYLKSITDKHSVSDSVIFTGLVKYKDIPSLLHGCDILVLARPDGTFARAGFPTKLGEYFACKIPVVLSSIGDFPLYFKDQSEVLFSLPSNPDDLANKILYLIDNPDLAEKISIIGFNWAKNNLEYRTKTESVKKFLIDK
jgi:glycosyltransferase involved in cell wall biosynthesis